MKKQYVAPEVKLNIVPSDILRTSGDNLVAWDKDKWSNVWSNF